MSNENPQATSTLAHSDAPPNLDPYRLSDHVQILVQQDFTEYSTDSRAKVRFLRVSVSNSEPVIRAIISTIADTSWVSHLLDDFVKEGFMARAQPTIDKLSRELAGAINNDITGDVGEYVVSVVARHIIEAMYGYKALPFAEFMKEKTAGNPGFDYHHEKDALLLIFGEAKYVTGSNAYGKAFKQIVDFIKAKKDWKEAPDLNNFLTEGTKSNFKDGKKGYSAAFSTSGRSSDSAALIKNIKKNTNFKALTEHEELLVVAVDIND